MPGEPFAGVVCVSAVFNRRFSLFGGLPRRRPVEQEGCSGLSPSDSEPILISSTFEACGLVKQVALLETVAPVETARCQAHPTPDQTTTGLLGDPKKALRAREGFLYLEAELLHQQAIEKAHPFLASQISKLSQEQRDRYLWRGSQQPNALEARLYSTSRALLSSLGKLACQYISSAAFYSRNRLFFGKSF